MRRIVSVFSLLLLAACTEPPIASGPVAHSRSIKELFVRVGVEEGNFVDSLYPLFPNPYNRVLGDSSVHIRFSTADSGRALVLIQNPIGEEVVRFEDRVLAPGIYEGRFNVLNSEGLPLNSGLYFVTFRTDTYIMSRMLSVLSN